MKEKRAPVAARIRVGLITLPPEGWEIGEKVERCMVTTWARRVPLEILMFRIGADPVELAGLLRRLVDREGLEVICTVGRSGHRAEDFTPDVTRKLLHRSLPGFEERMYLADPRRPEDLLFRGAAGIRKTTLIINLPGRMTRVREIVRFSAPVLAHALEKIAGSESECGEKRANP